MALLAVSVVSVLATAFFRVSMATTRSLVQETENTRAFYLAEAGLSEAFHGLRVGRRGQIGSATAPARHGNGLLWVDATEQVDGRVRLESTGMCGRGRATLALVVEPIELSLGFFSDEDLHVDSVLLVDGYDSTIGPYADQLGGDGYLPEPVPIKIADYLENSCDSGEHTTGHHLGIHNWCVAEYTHQEVYTKEDNSDIALFEEKLQEAYDAYVEEAISNGETERYDFPTGAASHTDGGGQLASNNDINLDAPSGEPIEVYGDVVPGEAGSLSGTALITGETSSRGEPVELPAVEVPSVATLPALLHDSPIPLVISSSSIGYASIMVVADAELIVRGPCTLVVGTLELEPGADIFLDTTDGDVQLYVAAGMNLAPGSRLTTSGEQPDEISIQVAEIAAPIGDAPVKLESTAQFHGTIYAPNTDVRVGSAFEIFGGMVAKSLDLAPAVKLHFDNAGYEGSPLPKLISWKIVKVPSVARRGGDPFQALNVTADELEVLHNAHDLTSVYLAISYVDHGGVVRTFDGLEEDFDWMDVASVLDSERALDEPVDTEEPDPGPLEPPRAAIEDALATLSGGALMSELLSMSPLSDSEMLAVVDAERMGTAFTKKVLQENPLSDQVLDRLVSGEQGLSKGDLKQVMIENSPLSPGTLALVDSADSGQLSIGDKNVIHDAQ
ncbi:MAG: hypothetical protein GY711_28085 [bacterium]|nr:hypothetical protein [bacterium]